MLDGESCNAGEPAALMVLCDHCARTWHIGCHNPELNKRSIERGGLPCPGVKCVLHAAMQPRRPARVPSILVDTKLACYASLYQRVPLTCLQHSKTRSAAP